MNKPSIILTAALLLSSCATTGNPDAIATGAYIGGMAGSIIGEKAKGWSGAQIGEIIGTVGGAVIANEITKPRNNKTQENPEDKDTRSNLQIKNIRFIDQDGDQRLSQGERASIIFEIANTSEETYTNVTPQIGITSGPKVIKFGSPATIDIIHPGERLKYTYMIKGKNMRSRKTTTIYLQLKSDNKKSSEKITFALPLT